MREQEYTKLADEVQQLQSDMRRIELASVAAVGGICAFLLTEKFGMDFLFFGSLLPLLVTLAAALRYVAYFYQLKRIRTYLATKEQEAGYDGWEAYLVEHRGTPAARLAAISSIVFWLMLLVYSLAFFIVVLAYD